MVPKLQKQSSTLTGLKSSPCRQKSRNKNLNNTDEKINSFESKEIYGKELSG